MTALRRQPEKFGDTTWQLCLELCSRGQDFSPMKETLLIERLKSSPTEIFIFLECLGSFPIDSGWNILNSLVPSWSPGTGKTKNDIEHLRKFTKKCLDSVLELSLKPTNHQSVAQPLGVHQRTTKPTSAPRNGNNIIRSILFFVSTEADKLCTPSTPISSQKSVQLNCYPLSLIRPTLPTLLLFLLSEDEEISSMAQSLLMQATHMDGGCFCLLKTSLSPSTLLDDLNPRTLDYLSYRGASFLNYPDMDDFIDTMLPLIQSSKQNTNEMKSSEILLTLLKKFRLPLETDISNYHLNFLQSSVLDQLLNDLHPSCFTQLLTECIKMNKQTEITFSLTEANLCKLIDNVDVVSSPELATLLVAFLSSAHKLYFPSARFAGVTHSNAQPKEMRTGLVLAELLLNHVVKAEQIPNCISALLLHLISSPNLNYTNTLVHAVHLNIEHLFGSRLNAERIPSLFRALLDFEAVLPVISGSHQVEIAILVELCRYRVFNIILALLNFREEETTQKQNQPRQSSLFGRNRTDDPLRYYKLSHSVDLDAPQRRLRFETDGAVSAMKWNPSHKPISLLDLYGRRSHFRSPSSISIQQKSLLLEISQSLLSRISERLPHFMDRTWWEGLKQPSDPLSRSYSFMDRSFLGLDLLDEQVFPTVMNIVTSLSVLTPEIKISQLTRLLSPLVWSENESVFRNVRQAFITISKNSNRPGFLLRVQVDPSHEPVPLPPSPQDELGGPNHPAPPPPPLTSQPAHQPIAEKTFSIGNPQALHDFFFPPQVDKTKSLLNVFVQRGLHFGKVDFETTMKILNGVDHKSRMAMLTFLVEELVDRRTTSLVGIPQVIVGLKFFAPQLSDLILPFSRLIRISTHSDGTVHGRLPRSSLEIDDLTHRRVVTLLDIAKMIVWMMSTPIEREGDMKTFRQLTSLLSSALISSLICLPTLHSRKTAVELPLPIGSTQVGTCRVAADRASVWKTSLLEEGLFDFLGFFFNEGIADCVSFFGFNCTFPISPALHFVPRPPLNIFNTGYRHGRRRRF